MLGITAKEADLMRTFSFSLKMKNHEKMVKHFKDKFEQESNLHNAFNFGMCMSIYIIIDPNDSDKSKHLVAVNEAFEKCLRYKSEWWIVRYLRSEINEGIPEEAMQKTDAVPFPVFEKANPAQDRELLIEQQRNSPKQFSYFLCPYIAQTRAYIRKGKIDEALACYKNGMTMVPIAKSPFNLSFLTRPFYETIVQLRKMGHTDAADEIKTCGLTLFPDSKNLCMA